MAPFDRHSFLTYRVRSGRFHPMMDLVFVRTVFIIVVTIVSWLLQPFGLDPLQSLLAGLFIGFCIIFFEMRLRAVSLKQLIGAVLGSVLGIIGSFLITLILRDSLGPGSTQSFIKLVIMLLMTYVG